MEGKLRPYEPLLMTLRRFSDAFLGAVLLPGLAWYYGMYEQIYIFLAVFTLLSTLICMHVMGIYRSWRTEAFFITETRRLLSACLAVYVILFASGYLLKVSSEFSRRVILTWMILWPLLLLAERVAIRNFLKYQRQQGRNIRKCVIAGSGDLGRRIAHWLESNPWSGTKILGFFDDKVRNPVKGYPVLGTLEELCAFVKAGEVDAVYLTLPMRAEAKIQRLVSDLADSTVSIYLVPDIFFFDILLGGTVTFFDDSPVVSLRDTPMRGINTFLKRAEDLILSGIMLLATSPVILLIILMIKFTSNGPVFFKQWRYGLNGKPIQIYKFRTMTVCEDGYEFKQATKDDPRVTRLGALLRRTSLDELPQLINVFQGRMSIVGPRPHPLAMNETYRKLVPGYMLRHKVKPGLTGLAQVKGFRGETDTLDKMEHRVEYDLKYLRNWSLFLDLRIIFMTVNIVLRTNAY